MKHLSLLLLLLAPLSLLAQKGSTITIHELSDPDGMNPLTSTSANGYYMQGNIFQKLLEYDQQTLKLRPVLAREMPVVKEIKEGAYKGGMSISYEIHPDAVWDNGTPVTAEDYIFTIKALKNPKVNARFLRTYFEFVDDIVMDKKNKKKFTIYASQIYFRAVETSGQESFILPEYHYDPNQIMREFSFEELNDDDKVDELSRNPKIIEFAKHFNSPQYAQEPQKAVGSGPYSMVDWQVGEYVLFKKKKKWWGKKVKNNDLLAVYPSEIKYLVVPDMTYAINLAKDGQIDIIRGIAPSTFSSLNADKNFKRGFDLATPQQFAYHYLGLNSKLPKLQDVKVRKAIAHAINRDDIIDQIFDGYAIKTNGPIAPAKDYYNHEIKDMDFDLEQSRKYLADAGWTDSDKNGILDKVIDGKKEEFRLIYSYNQGNRVRKNIGQLLKENLKQLNIELILDPVDFPTLLYKADKRDFEIIALAWVNPSGLDDMKQIWHSSSDKEGGSNRVGFGDEDSDEVINTIQKTLDIEKRKELYLDIQKKIADAQCYIFLVVPKERIAISNKYKYPKPSSVRPSYIARFFRLKN